MDVEGDEGTPAPSKKPEELTPEEKEELEARANQFGVELENCMYEQYSEPDKAGKQVVAGKYKCVSIFSPLRCCFGTFY